MIQAMQVYAYPIIGRKHESLVEVVSADVQGGDDGTIDAKENPEIGFHRGAENRRAGHGGEPLDFVASQPGIKRILFEDFERRLGGLLLGGAEAVETSPKSSDCLVGVAHSCGGRSRSAVSRSTTRPAL